MSASRCLPPAAIAFDRHGRFGDAKLNVAQDHWQKM
jgi:hypothetical protein